MAEMAVLGAFLQVLFDKLATPLLNDLKKFLGMEKDLKKLTVSIEHVQSVLSEAGKRKLSDETVRLWLRDLQEAAYEFEDVTDELIYEARRQSVESSPRVIGIRKRDKFKTLFSTMSPHQAAFRHRMAGKIDQVSKKLEDSARRRNHLRIDSQDDSLHHSSSRRESSSFVSEPFIAGRTSEKEQIVATLLREDGGDGELPVLPIVGIPGMGKTTLAQLVFNDERVNSVFDPCIWVCVSLEFDVKRLTRQILEAATREKVPEFSALDVLQKDLSERLRGRRFLLVLDDVWNPSEWPQLRPPLLRGGKGSWILLTTRYPMVADRMGTVAPVNLKGLSLEDCRKLLQKSASAHLDLERSPVPDEICRKIVDRLDGAPLVVKTVGRILPPQFERRWGEILDSVIWESSGGEGSILQILKLSYEDLAPHLKRCFTYCSLFPKRFEFDKSKLVKLWIAQGYVIRKEGRRCEDVGNDYFEELLSKSFFRRFNSRYVMYDLFHNLTQHVASNGCIRMESGTEKLAPITGVYHVSFSLQDSRFIPKDSPYCRMRSLIFVNQFIGDSNGGSFLELPHEIFSFMPCLRVLDLSGSNIASLPESVGSLIYLKFLDLSHTIIDELPEAISRLHNLYALELRGCPHLREIPSAVLNLVNLEHLNASGKLIANLPGIGKLTLLQELELFTVSKKEGQGIAQLQHMNQLHGRLSITNIQNVSNAGEAEQADLKGKKHLEELDLVWSKELGVASQASNSLEGKADILEKLQPPPNIKNLSVIGNGEQEPPKWMNRHLIGNLRSIRLRDCSSWCSLPPLGTLQHLVVLKIEYFLSVESVDNDFYGTGIAFPCLEELEFRHMHKLKKWHEPADHRRSFRSLKKLVMEDCPILENLYFPEAVKCLKVEKCREIFSKSSFVLLKKLLSLSSFSCSFEDGYTTLQSCVDLALRYLNSLEGLDICLHNKHVTNDNWAQRPQWMAAMAYNFNRDHLADGSSRGSTSNMYDGTNICIFLLYASNFPEYRDVRRRDVCLRVRNAGSMDSSDYRLLSDCLQGNLHSLKRLSVKGCKRLESLLGKTVLLHLDTLEELVIEDCYELMSLEWFLQQQNFVCLRTLKIINCPDLISLPEIEMTALEELRISGCESLVSLDLNVSARLRRMEISDCPKLKSKLFANRFQSLHELRLHRCSPLTFAADVSEAQLEKFTFLECLDIRSCKDLKQLQIDLKSLSSLKSLSIMECPEMISLPETGLPESLKELHIEGCPILQQRCQVGGVEWCKVVDIPKKIISCPKCHPFRCSCNQR